VEFDTDWRTLGKHRIKLRSTKGFPTELMLQVAEVARLAVDNNMSARARIVEIVYRHDKAYDITVPCGRPDLRGAARKRYCHGDELVAGAGQPVCPRRHAGRGRPALRRVRTDAGGEAGRRAPDTVIERNSQGALIAREITSRVDMRYSSLKLQRRFTKLVSATGRTARHAVRWPLDLRSLCGLQLNWSAKARSLLAA